MPNSDTFIRQFMYLTKEAKALGLEFETEHPGMYGFKAGNVVYRMKTLREAIAWLDGYRASQKAKSSRLQWRQEYEGNFDDQS